MMLPTHRKAHFRVWTLLAIVLPLILIGAAVLKPVPLAKDAIKLDNTGAAAKK